MRPATLLFSLCVVAVLALAQISSAPKTSLQSGSQFTQHAQATDGVRMWRRAEIRVVPLDLVAANRVELQSLRERQQRLEADSRKLDLSDPAVHEQISRQLQLIHAVLSYVDRQDSDQGKSVAALDVQRHLNQIEGQMMCEACHTSVMSRLGARQDRAMTNAIVNKTPSSPELE